MKQTHIGFVMSALALGLSIYGLVAQFKPSTATQVVMTQKPASRDTNESYEQIINTLNAQVFNLEARLRIIEQHRVASDSDMVKPPNFEQAVLAVLEQKQAREQEEMRNKDPAYAFYENLPKDYELKLKTDPEYALQTNKDLNAKILDSSLSAHERLSAMGQLQMNMYVLNKTQMRYYNYETVDAILRIAQQSDDEAIKVQALEVITNTPLTDARVAENFVSIIEKEPNEYLRSMAADGLMLQYYQSKNKQPELNLQLAQQILSLYQQGDSKLKNLLKNNMFNEDMLTELNEQVGN
ncbi:hypothetical protein PSECIP111854_01212 [Pseudoalteromonas sp. CIP111854]|uniref:Uncharacterized protein n=1 Tax=Pseudoalteromonas holothuriae TaxID=2963714 RepID=A0A9W4QU43_9GAMM|nr:hypothetical protein [Pseudoalteromonas sp. CIP111854]CAH9053653.1 hypothetical protein PSECIP111854_01212 [Pseudoalteromonas sp. CIP111854]